MYEDENVDLKPKPEHLLQHEFSVIVFLDYLCERPFDLVYQQKTVQQYQNTIMGDLVSVRNEIRESWIDNRVDDGIVQIISRTEEVAKQHGFSASIRSQSMKYILPMMIGFFALAFLVIFFVQFPPELYWLTYVIYTALLLVVCFLPRLINKRLLKRWMNLADEQSPMIKKYISGAAERLHKFNQFLIDDIREILAVNDLDLANYRLMLFNPNYENVKVLSQETRRGVTFFIMELLPLGVAARPEDGKAEPEYDEFGGPEF